MVQISSDMVSLYGTYETNPPEGQFYALSALFWRGVQDPLEIKPVLCSWVDFVSAILAVLMDELLMRHCLL